MKMYWKLGWRLPHHWALLTYWYRSKNSHGYTSIVISILGIHLMMILGPKIEDFDPSENAPITRLQMQMDMLEHMSQLSTQADQCFEIGLGGYSITWGNFHTDLLVAHQFRKRTRIYFQDAHGPFAEYSPTREIHYYAYRGWLVTSRMGLPVSIRRGFKCVAIRTHDIVPEKTTSGGISFRTGNTREAAEALMTEAYSSHQILVAAMERLMESTKELSAELKKMQANR